MILTGGPFILDLAGPGEGPCGRLLAGLGARVVQAEASQPRTWRPLLDLAEVILAPAGLDLDWPGPGRLDAVLITLDAGVEEDLFARLGAWWRTRSDLIRSLAPAVTALFGTLAALLALRRARLTGQGAAVTVSRRMSLLALAEPLLHHGQTGPSFALLPCRDGWLQAGLHGEWATLAGWLEADGAAQELTQPAWLSEDYRRRHRDRLLDILARWSQGRSAAELAATAQAMRLPWAPALTPAEARAWVGRAGRRFSAAPAWLRPPFLLDGGSPDGCLGPVSSSPPGQPGPASPLAGVRVLDFTRLLAGPWVTRFLADHGAEVIKVQSRLTATGAEENGTPFFAAWNRNKRSVTLDLSKSEARDVALGLAGRSEVVVENFSPRVMANLGLDHARLRRARPDLVRLSLSALGATGPHRDWVGLAPTLHALAGLTRWGADPAGRPQDLGLPLADLAAGLWGAVAVLAALERRDSTGQGACLDLSILEAVLSLLDQGGPGDQSTEPSQPLPAWNRAETSSYPFLPGLVDPASWRPAPRLGQDNDSVLGELLGLSGEERRRLAAAGALG